MVIIIIISLQPLLLSPSTVIWSLCGDFFITISTSTLNFVWSHKFTKPITTTTLRSITTLESLLIDCYCAIVGLYFCPCNLLCFFTLWLIAEWARGTRLHCLQEGGLRFQSNWQNLQNWPLQQQYNNPRNHSDWWRDYRLLRLPLHGDPDGKQKAEVGKVVQL